MQYRRGFCAALTVLILWVCCWNRSPAEQADVVVENVENYGIAKLKVGQFDWPQWGGTSLRNNTPKARGIATKWDVTTGENIKWIAKLGSQTYGTPVIANGKVYVGTNNGGGFIERYPSRIDLGCLLCFDESTGKLLWQHSNEKLAAGRVNDWPLQGISVCPLVDGDRLWYVSSRGEVVCLDTEGFLDGENDGPFQDEKPINPNVPWDEKLEADVVWKFDMMRELGTSQHNMCCCSVTAAGDLLFVNTSNGVDESHGRLPSPKAPSFIALNRHTGKVVWTDNSPGENVLHGQWSSPAYAILGGVEQVLFGGGDGWMYSFEPLGNKGKSSLLWKFDCNPKDARFLLGGRATRNHIVGTPVIYDGMVYIAVGEDPEHGEAPGRLWCIDPTKRGDVSPTLVFNANAPKPDQPIAHKRLQALDPKAGDFEIANLNSAEVWQYAGANPPKFADTMHRTCGTVAAKNGLLIVADFSGLVHCLDAKTGGVHWTHDMLAAVWGSPLIVEEKIYIGDEDGDIAILELSNTKTVINEVNMGNSVYTTPVVAKSVLFITNKDHLFAIKPGAMFKIERK